ncbi:hypothetical protein LCG94_05770 [Aeromonas salmonicida]|uniref:hypothetical protein n=1 Tax=Aeromonas salmonicida TaxID=645 RepID=UPI003BB5F09C
MQSRVKLQPSETLKRESSRTKGSMGQIDIVTYAVLNADGAVVGKVVHTDEITLNGLNNRQSLRQTDLAGNVVVEEFWSE